DVPRSKKAHRLLPEKSQPINHPQQRHVTRAARKIPTVSDTEPAKGGQAADDRSEQGKLAHVSSKQMSDERRNQKEAERHERADTQHRHRNRDAEEQAQQRVPEQNIFLECDGHFTVEGNDEEFLPKQKQ